MRYTVQHIKSKFRAKEPMSFIFFYSHHPDKSGVTKSCLSNWWVQPFKVDGVAYAHNEQYIMAEKARLFNDSEVEKLIMSTKSQQKAKDLGRSVRGFDKAIWNEHLMDIAVKGMYAKFSQNPDLKSYLLSTGDAILVEASPTDTIWGIGLSSKDSRVNNPLHWRGTNFQGFALMEVRDMIRSEG